MPEYLEIDCCAIDVLYPVSGPVSNTYRTLLICAIQICEFRLGKWPAGQGLTQALFFQVLRIIMRPADRR